jgi:hypothetical protein
MDITSFTITNNTKAPMTVVHEPEATEWECAIGEGIEIITNACEKSISISASIIKGKVCLQIFDENSRYTVKNNASDVF